MRNPSILMSGAPQVELDFSFAYFQASSGFMQFYPATSTEDVSSCLCDEGVAGFSEEIFPPKK